MGLFAKDIKTMGDVFIHNRIQFLNVSLFDAFSSRTNINQEKFMDRDRIEGAVEQAKGKVKEVAGKATGDAKLEGEGKADQVAGKVQNAIGGIKDTLRGK